MYQWIIIAIAKFVSWLHDRRLIELGRKEALLDALAERNNRIKRVKSVDVSNDADRVRDDNNNRHKL